jgi:hypothetical protein
VVLVGRHRGPHLRTCAPAIVGAESDLVARYPRHPSARRHIIRYLDMRKTLSLLCLVLAIATPVAAQTWTPEQQELWKLEDLQWKMNAAKDATWIPKLVHPNMSAWSNDSPAPQTMASLTKWNRHAATQSTTLEYEIYPIAATITGNVAVMQYTYREATENSKKEHRYANGRWTDVLIKENGVWKFITWAGGQDPAPEN